MKRQGKNKEFLIGVGFFVLGVVYFALAFTIPSYDAYGGSSVVDSSFLPKVIGALLMGLSVLQMMSAKRKDTESAVLPAESTPNQETEEFKVEDYDDDAVTKNADTKSLLAIFATLVLYIALMPLLGFMLSTVLFLIGSISLLTPAGKRNIPLMLILSVVVSGGVYYLFVNGLSLILPAGILG